MCGGGNDASDAIRQQEANRTAAISSGMEKIDTAFKGFTPAFYDSMQAATLAQLTPQVGQQYRANRLNLATSLADAGIGSSSAANRYMTSLEAEKNRQMIGVTNQALQSRQALQGEVSKQKQNVTNQLVTSQNPTLAAQSATEAASQIQAPSAIAPLGNLFSQWANIYMANSIRNAMPQFAGGGFSLTPSVAGLGSSGGGGTLNQNVGQPFH